MPRHCALARRSIFRLCRRIPAQLSGRYAGGANANEQLTFARPRLRELGRDQHRALGRVIYLHRFHSSKQMMESANRVAEFCASCIIKGNDSALETGELVCSPG